MTDHSDTTREQGGGDGRRSGESFFGGRAALLHGAPAGVLADDHCVDRLTHTDPSRENVLLVTYERDLSPDELWGRWNGAVGARPAEFGVISVGDTTRSAARGTPRRATGGGAQGIVTTLEDPTDLTGLGSAVVTYLDEWAENDNRTVVCFGSITTMLRHVGVETAFQFVADLANYVERVGARAHFHVDPSVHHEDTLAALGDRFERVVERPSAPDHDEGPSLSEEAIEKALRSPRRRALIDELSTTTGPVAVDDLAERLAVREAATDIGAAEDHAVEEIRTDLHHTHLPLLSYLGVVTAYDGLSRVELMDSGRRIEVRLREPDTLADRNPGADGGPPSGHD